EAPQRQGRGVVFRGRDDSQNLGSRLGLIRANGGRMAEGRIRIGIGGWTYPPWRGVFYPDKLPQRQELEYASRQLGAIEINATFYGRQKPKNWEGWGKVAPDSFQFAIKGSRYSVSRPQPAGR